MLCHRSCLDSVGNIRCHNGRGINCFTLVFRWDCTSRRKPIHGSIMSEAVGVLCQWVRHNARLVVPICDATGFGSVGGCCGYLLEICQFWGWMAVRLRRRVALQVQKCLLRMRGPPDSLTGNNTEGQHWQMTHDKLQQGWEEYLWIKRMHGVKL